MTNQLDECCSIPGVLSREGRMVFTIRLRCRPLSLCGSRYLYAQVYPDWTCGTPTPDCGTSQGFEPLTKSSRSNSPTNCTLRSKSTPKCTLIGHVGPQSPTAEGYSIS